MILTEKELKERCEALTIDEFPDIYGSSQLLEYYILHADLREDDETRSILYLLYNAASSELTVRASLESAAYTLSLSKDGVPSDTVIASEEEIKASCDRTTEKMRAMIREQEKKDRFSVIVGGMANVILNAYAEGVKDPSGIKEYHGIILEED